MYMYIYNSLISIADVSIYVGMYIYTHTHTHIRARAHTYIYIYIYICVYNVHIFRCTLTQLQRNERINHFSRDAKYIFSAKYLEYPIDVREHSMLRESSNCLNAASHELSRDCHRIVSRATHVSPFVGWSKSHFATAIVPRSWIASQPAMPGIAPRLKPRKGITGTCIGLALSLHLDV